jgi:hypothetical protein
MREIRIEEVSNLMIWFNCKPRWRKKQWEDTRIYGINCVVI